MSARGKGPLRIAIEDFLLTFEFGRKFREWLIDTGERMESAIADETADLRSLVIGGLDDDDPIKETISRLTSGKKPVGIAILGVFALSIGHSVVSALTAPSMRKVTQSMERVVRSQIPPPGDIVAMRLFRSADRNFGLDDMAKLGFSDEYIRMYELLGKPRLAVGDIINLERRGFISKVDRVQLIKTWGWQIEEQALLDKLSLFMPPIQDLITMAVKEAFNPSFIQAAGLDTEIPPEYLRHAREQGLTDEWSTKYWIAHWRLPSPLQGFEMLHRLRPGTTNNPFTLNDMNALLKALDISPGYRDQMIEIAFSPYTRVDVRRMYKAGVLTEEDVFSAYLDIGYDPDKAAKLTEFTVQDAGTDGKELSRSAVERAYSRRMFDRNTAKSLLMKLRYSDANSDVFLNIIDFNKDVKRNDEIMDGIEKRFLAGQITEGQAIVELGALGTAGQEVEDIMVLWRIRADKQIRIPSRSELDTLYLDDIISVNTYKDLLIRKKYLPESVNWFVALTDNKRADQARREVERAQKEQQRLADTTTSTEYLIAKTGLDVEIAEFKVILAQMKVIANQTDDPTIIKDIKSRIPIIKSEIANLKLQQAIMKHDKEIILGDSV